MPILESIGLGAITGLVGPIITNITNYKLQKEKNSHEILKIKAESEAVTVEANANIQIERTITEGKIAEGELTALTESMKNADVDMFKESYMDKLPGWVAGIIAFCMLQIDMLRRSIRPVATIYLMGATTWITVKAYEILQVNGPEAISVIWAQKLFEDVIITVIYLTVSCISWWFCDRQVKKFVDKQISKPAVT